MTDPAGKLPHADLGDEWKFIPENVALREEILGVTYSGEEDAFEVHVARPNPLPGGEFWFENTWAEYRSGAIFKRTPDEEARPLKIYEREFGPQI